MIRRFLRWLRNDDAEMQALIRFERRVWRWRSKEWDEVEEDDEIL